MSRGGQTLITAELLLSALQQSISRNRHLHTRLSAVCFVDADGNDTYSVPSQNNSTVAPSPTPSTATVVQTALIAMETRAEAIGSLPSSPPTLRGRIGLALIRSVNRWFWWQTQMQQSFARAACDFARTVSQEQAELYAASEKIRNVYAVLQGAFDRLGKVEQQTQELQRNNIESRVIARFEARFASLEEALGMKYDKSSFSASHAVKTHQQVYLPILRDSGIGTSAMPIVDLECGRGEWLEVLQAEGLTARGVDSNPDNIEACMAIGLHVVKEDSLLYLAALPAASVGAVTSFDMIKPDPLRLIIDLIDHAFRVLKSDGLFILETSNPSNLLLWLFMETRGFQRMRRLDYSIIGERP